MRGLRVPKKRRALPGKEQRKTEITTPKAPSASCVLPRASRSAISALDGRQGRRLDQKLMELGQMATLNQVLDVDTAPCSPASSATA